MAFSAVTIGLPIADRATSRDFYRAVLGAEPFGPPGDDGMPEPMRFAVTTGVNIMLVPTEGFGRVIGDHRVAPTGHSECVLNLSVPTRDDVAAVVDRARAAGARVVTEPADQPWGHAGAFADPDGHLWMVMPAGS